MARFSVHSKQNTLCDSFSFTVYLHEWFLQTNSATCLGLQDMQFNTDIALDLNKLNLT